MSRTAVIVGSSGLVGGCCLERLLHDQEYTRVIPLVRRNALVRHQKTDERIVNFDDLGAVEFPPGADVFCALGTTIRKAGSQGEFRKVDLDYPVALATRAHALAARQFLVVSSVGADPQSSNFYLRTKGEMEQAVSAIPFQAVHIFRPSFLVGNRSERRRGEVVGAAVAQKIGFLLVGGLRRYRPVEADTVAAAMVAAALGPAKDVNVYHFDGIRELARAMKLRRSAEV
jgi:uncharacterized protein YbjT (DUF2867 family)